jgi:hypothetical protein
MVHTLCVHDHVKIATSKMKSLTNRILKQLGKNGYQNASVWNVKQGKKTYDVLPLNPLWPAARHAN